MVSKCCLDTFNHNRRFCIACVYVGWSDGNKVEAIPNLHLLFVGFY